MCWIPLVGLGSFLAVGALHVCRRAPTLLCPRSPCHDAYLSGDALQGRSYEDTLPSYLVETCYGEASVLPSVLNYRSLGTANVMMPWA